MRRIGVVGIGAVGARVARQMLATDTATSVVLADPDTERLRSVTRTLGPNAAALTEGRIDDQGVDLVVVAAACGRHLATVRRCIRGGIPVVSTSDRMEDVQALLALDQQAREASVPVLVGVGFAPGLTCVLAAFCRERFDAVDEVHVAKEGTGGPACARQHHRALSSAARDWRDGGWVKRPGGSGRELVWFPDPIGGSDCYRAALPDALLLRPSFDQAARITARMAATRQDRFTSWLPMLSPPHPEGGVGAVRIELRGRRDGVRVIEILGAVERPAIAAAAVAATAADAVLAGTAGPGGVRGLAESVAPRPFLRSLAERGLTAQEFSGLFG